MQTEPLAPTRFVGLVLIHFFCSTARLCFIVVKLLVRTCILVLNVLVYVLDFMWRSFTVDQLQQRKDLVKPVDMLVDAILRACATDNFAKHAERLVAELHKKD